LRPGREVFLKPLLLFVVLIVAGIFNADAATLNGVQKSVLDSWLLRNPLFRLATENDCDCSDDIRDMREYGGWGTPIPDYQPYVLTGDFRRNRRSDFAVIVTRIDGSYNGQSSILIFDGPFRKGSNPRYVGGVGSLKQTALFASKSGGVPIYGHFESEGCLYKPTPKSYAEDCGDF
jgi:hypothetical protein